MGCKKGGRFPVVLELRTIGCTGLMLMGICVYKSPGCADCSRSMDGRTETPEHVLCVTANSLTLLRPANGRKDQWFLLHPPKHY